MAPTNANIYTEIRSYLQGTATCFGQLCGHLQGYKIRMLHTSITF